jgi:hypothetical protein
MKEQLPKPVLITTDSYVREYSGYDCSIDDTINLHLPARRIYDEMGLSWSGIEGHFFNGEGQLVAFDPTVRERGPSALLINKGIFLSFLKEKGYEIFWTILGEKMFIEPWKGQSKGRLEISGAYRILNQKVVGKVRARYKSP